MSSEYSVVGPAQQGHSAAIVFIPEARQRAGITCLKSSGIDYNTVSSTEIYHLKPMVVVISMKVAVPCENEAWPGAGICAGFVSCRKFLILDVDNGQVSGSPEMIAAPGGGANVFLLLGKGVHAAIVSGITETERQMIAGAGIRVFGGAAGTVGQAIQQFIEGKLKESSEPGSCCGV